MVKSNKSLEWEIIGRINQQRQRLMVESNKQSHQPEVSVQTCCLRNYETSLCRPCQLTSFPPTPTTDSTANSPKTATAGSTAGSTAAFDSTQERGNDVSQSGIDSTPSSTRGVEHGRHDGRLINSKSNSLEGRQQISAQIDNGESSIAINHGASVAGSTADSPQTAGSTTGRCKSAVLL